MIYKVLQSNSLKYKQNNTSFILENIQFFRCVLAKKLDVVRKCINI